MGFAIIDPVMTLSDITATKTLLGHHVGGQDRQDKTKPHMTEPKWTNSAHSLNNEPKTCQERYETRMIGQRMKFDQRHQD